MELEEAIEGLETDIYNLTNFLTDSEKEIWQKAIDTIINYIKEESIPKAVVEEKRKAILKEGKNMTEEERQKETMFLQGKLIALEELLNKGG